VVRMKKDNFFFVRAPYYVITSLRENEELCIWELARKSGIQYAYVHKLLEKFLEAGLIEVYKKGRKCYISLTERGKEVRKLLNKIESFLRVENKNEKEGAI